jgi:dTDP-4-amino-4,6-dideoxygalactose transaminase
MITVTKSSLPPLEKYIEYLEKIWSSRWLTNDGEFVKRLEKELQEYLKVKNVVLVSNGTVALQLALRALNLKGEVITTPFTFVATTNAILMENLTPVFADIDTQTFNIDPKYIEKKITKKTSAILAVHVYGNPCYVEELQEIANKHNLKLLYDAAHAFGVEYKNQSVLNYGDASMLSFHATKVFNTVEGGAIVTDNEQMVEKLKLLRNHGIKSEEEFSLPGTNAKMNEFQAAMGLCNLEKHDTNIEQRETIYKRYAEKLGKLQGVQLQRVITSKYNYSYFPICFENRKKRDQVWSELSKKGIKTRRYFFPLTVDTPYFQNIQKEDLKVAFSVADRVLCLPIYPDLEKTSVDYIIESVISVI